MVGNSDTYVVIAAFNEAPVIRGVVAEIAARGYSVIVVDDGSRDDTAASARVPGVVVLRHAVNLGQGAALQTGIEYAVRRGAHQVVTFDADGQHSVEDIPELIAALATHDIALGSRFLGKQVIGVTRGRRTFLRAATSVSNRLSGMKLSDAHCGLRLQEVPVTVKYTEYSTRKGQSGFQAIRILFDYFFRPS